jgi:hypothetical protein
MFESLFQALIFSIPDLLIYSVARTARAYERDAANSGLRPYDWRNRTEDPVYKKNLERLVERSRQFEEKREARNAPRSRHD